MKENKISRSEKREPEERGLMALVVMVFFMIATLVAIAIVAFVKKGLPPFYDEAWTAILVLVIFFFVSMCKKKSSSEYF